ncbi:hypothetical protein BJP39_30325 [Streptomyces sp. CC77]|nr:hypothetical protein BJP39_30325 [Streptomyces sp. CC77]
MTASAEPLPTVPRTVTGLSWDVYHGRACVWCHKLLMEPGARPVARVEEYAGVHDLSTTVWGCAPCCQARGVGEAP